MFYIENKFFLKPSKFITDKVYLYGRKSVDRIATQSMSSICNLWRLIVVDCDCAESYERFLSKGNADVSHMVYIVPDDR